jgi:hypothetical protein
MGDLEGQNMDTVSIVAQAKTTSLHEGVRIF